jgi:D-glycero-beta-D-manno-heptose-7-phosphate kinase
MTITLKRARQILANGRRQRVLVIGDLMLDRYIYGGVSRISPEAPVPVISVTHEKIMPGGAANVAWNIQSLEGRAAVCGVLGRDRAGVELTALLRRNRVGVDGAMVFAKSRTTVKMRVVAERQQAVRVDWDNDLQLSAKSLRRFCRRVAREVERSSGVIIEDYGKGVIRQEVVSTILAAARRKGIPVGLDPKENHELDVRGITVATPNRKEAFGIAGIPEPQPQSNPLKDAALRRVGTILLRKWEPAMLLITLGPQGILLVTKDGHVRHVPTRAREVFDVSGAGDTVIATCVLALAAGASPVEATELANYAAGVVVGKLGTAACAPAELLSYVE